MPLKLEKEVPDSQPSSMLWKLFSLGQLPYLMGFKDNYWPQWNEASNSLKTSGLYFLVDFFHFFSIFQKFDFRNGLHMSRGPQKGIFFGWFIRGQVALQGGPQCIIKYNLTWCIFLSLSEHVQCICQLIMAIHGLWWPLMASIFIKNDVLCVKYYYFSIFYSSTWLDLPSGPKEGKVLRWC